MEKVEPKPLDLEILADEIIRLEYPTYDQIIIPQLKDAILSRKNTIKQILEQHIKSACEFYLRYKNKLGLLAEECPREFLYVKELCPSYEGNKRCKVEHTLCRFPACIWFSLKNISIKKYNEWLFRLAFKDVFEEVKNG